MANDLGNHIALVTGAAGWLGQRLVEALAEGLPGTDALREPPAGLKIRALVLPGQDCPVLHKYGDRVERIEGDIRDPAVCSRLCDGAGGAVLYHTAGVIHPRRIKELYAVNVDGTKHLLDAATTGGVRRIVAVSSNSPCGCNLTRADRFDESSPYNPYMHYGRSKMLMEQAIRDARRGGKIEAVILRAPWFYGPYQPQRQTLFFHMIRDGKAPIVGDGNNLRSMCYTDNLCQGLVLSAREAKADGQTYWIADERPYTMNEIIDSVERLLEDEFGIRCAHKRMRIPALACGVALLVDRGIQALGLYQQKIHVLSEMDKTIACSIDKAKAELGYAPRFALQEGMRASISWLLKAGGGSLT